MYILSNARWHFIKIIWTTSPWLKYLSNAYSVSSPEENKRRAKDMIFTFEELLVYLETKLTFMTQVKKKKKTTRIVYIAQYRALGSIRILSKELSCTFTGEIWWSPPTLTAPLFLLLRGTGQKPCLTNNISRGEGCTTTCRNQFNLT